MLVKPGLLDGAQVEAMAKTKGKGKGKGKGKANNKALLWKLGTACFKSDTPLY